jgi:hypothetical protein
MAEEREHFAGFGGVWTDVAADKLVGMGQKILRKRHPPKIKFARRKSELDLRGRRLAAGLVGTQWVWLASKNRHN